MKKQFAKLFLAILVSVLILLPAPNAWALASVNLNTATQAELESLPGVGAAVASEIIAARPFKSVDDLANVKGIGDKRFKRLAPLVSVEAPAAKRSASRDRSDSRIGSSSSAHDLAPGEKIDLNRASLQELERLPGIGPARAQAIIDGRPYKSVSDVMKVKGIKEGVMARINEHVTVD